MEEWSATASPEHVADLRRALAAFAADHGVPASRLTDVEIAVSEVVSNAVVHAYRHQEHPGTVTVLARKGDGEVIIQVVDEGSGPQPRDDSPGAGLGLTIASQIADCFAIEPVEPAGTEVRFSFAAA